MSVAAAGALAKPFEGVAILIAACPSFQSAVDAADAAEALTRVFYPELTLRPEIEVDDTDEEIEVATEAIPVRPWCIITNDQQCEFQYDFNTKRAHGSLIVSFEFPIDPETPEDSPDALFEFVNLIGLILDEMGERAGTPNGPDAWYWNVTLATTITPPSRCSWKENPDPTDMFYGASFKIDWV